MGRVQNHVLWCQLWGGESITNVRLILILLTWNVGLLPGVNCLLVHHVPTHETLTWGSFKCPGIVIEMVTDGGGCTFIKGGFNVVIKLVVVGLMIALPNPQKYCLVPKMCWIETCELLALSLPPQSSSPRLWTGILLSKGRSPDYKEKETETKMIKILLPLNSTFAKPASTGFNLPSRLIQ